MRCRLGLHKMVWDEHAYPGGYLEPDEPGYLCERCDGLYPDVMPLRWRLTDWWFGTRLGAHLDWLIDRADARAKEDEG